MQYIITVLPLEHFSPVVKDYCHHTHYARAPGSTTGFVWNLGARIARIAWQLFQFTGQWVETRSEGLEQTILE